MWNVALLTRLHRGVERKLMIGRASFLLERVHSRPIHLLVADQSVRPCPDPKTLPTRVASPVRPQSPSLRMMHKHHDVVRRAGS
jgi:hypothetical protein